MANKENHAYCKYLCIQNSKNTLHLNVVSTVKQLLPPTPAVFRKTTQNLDVKTAKNAYLILPMRYLINVCTGWSFVGYQHVTRARREVEMICTCSLEICKIQLILANTTNSWGDTGLNVCLLSGSAASR